ncbi:uncharacterized protein LOC109052228 [Cyprinus carpio]|uniref:Uncharacterized protein LOC109052228 n=1 Tax=Cyprinus carpio TaxID=7962 RepID=A0A9Q9XZ86_CYPCA|nr:uncharacterized protein LOC109052228 [Cyprinus carpio]
MEFFSLLLFQSCDHLTHLCTFIFVLSFVIVYGRTTDSYRTFIMFRCLNLLLLLLFCLVYHSETPFVRTTPVSVTGKKGDSAILSCQFEPSDIFRIDLWRQKSIFSCQNETCENGRFSKKGCDVTIKNLSFSDAGKYTLKVFYNHNQTVLNQKQKMYQLHIQDNISVQEGGELGDLPSAHKVLHQPSGSTKWEDVWPKDQSDVNLHNFRTNHTGTYRVLDSEGNILITVTVTESGTESKDKQDDTNKDKTEPLPVWALILIVIVIGVVLVLAVIIFIVIKKPQCLKRDADTVTYRNPSDVAH